jgi:hypothetical protein
MSPHVVVSAAVLASLLTGCGPVAAAWPHGYRDAICAATDAIRAVDDQLAVAARAVMSDDAEQVAVAAAGMEREAGDARSALVQAPRWDPGVTLANDLDGAAAGFLRAAQLFRTGARQGNGPALDLAVAAGQEAEAALNRTGLEGERLRNAIGWQPC